MTLAIFDLDNTLIAGDSDYTWGRFLAGIGVVDGNFHERENQRFYDEYKAGTLDIHEFLSFSLRPLSQHSMETLHGWRDEFMEQKILPLMLPKARELLKKHRDQGDTLIIITATNRFITEPIAQAFDVEHLIATEPEILDNSFTGEIIDVPCYREGKVKLMQRWTSFNGGNLNESWFYSDSHNDIPLLEVVEHPVAVDPDETLAQYARDKGWPVISLRDTDA